MPASETLPHILTVSENVWTLTLSGAAGSNAVTSATTSDGTAALYLDSIRFESSNGGPTQLGEMAWESTDGSIDAQLENGVIAAFAEDGLIRVRNTSGVPIAKGDALRFIGTNGATGRLNVGKWVGANVTNAREFMGFAACAMNDNSNGYAQWFGKLEGITTTGGGEAWIDGQIIYAVGGSSATITDTAPTAAGEYVVAAAVINAGSGTSGSLFVRPSFAKNIASADIVDATSDGQTNPGKLLKTDANGALQIEELTLGNQTIGTNGGLRVVGTNNTATIYNSSDTSAALAFGSTSGTIMVGANNLSEISSASTARTNLGAGTAGDAIFQAATYTGTGSVRKLMGLDTTDSPTFAGATLTDGFLIPSNGTGASVYIAKISGGSRGIKTVYDEVYFNTANGERYRVGDNYIVCNSACGFGVASGSPRGNPDTTLVRISANTWGVGNGFTATSGSISLTNLTASGTVTAANLALTEKSADPADPAEGKSVIWQSDGTGAGDDGDIMIKITAGGVTKTGTIIDFSTL